MTVRKLVVAAAATAFLLPIACDLGIAKPAHDTTAQTVDVLNQAITALDAQNSDWKRILQSAIGQLTQSAQATIRNELSDTLNRGIAAAGVEARCEVDFLAQRAHQALVRIRAQLLHQAFAPKEPAFCQAVPEAIDPARILINSLTHLEFWGYDFDTAPPIQVILEAADHTTKDISSSLASPTHYLLTLNLGSNGAGPAVAAPQSLTVHLRWNGKDISTVSITQPNVPHCVEVQKLVSPAATSISGMHTAGDSNFGGNGPHVWLEVYLSSGPAGVNAIVNFDAVETGGDHTAVSASPVIRLFTPGPQEKLEFNKVQVAKGVFEMDYIHDSGVGDVDTFTGRPDTLVQGLKFQGFSGDHAADGSTRVQVAWNPFYVNVLAPPTNFAQCA